MVSILLPSGILSEMFLPLDYFSDFRPHFRIEYDQEEPTNCAYSRCNGVGYRYWIHHS
jgi:hypothetical protein